MKPVSHKKKGSIGNRQKGVALVISLIFLLLLLMLGLSAMGNSVIATKMTANYQYKQLSFQAAESALARLLSPNPIVSKPNTISAASKVNSNYFTSTGITDQPNLSADLTLDFIKKSPPGQYKYSGYSLNVVSLVYQVDAIGRVDGSNAKSHNRMQVTLIRQ